MNIIQEVKQWANMKIQVKMEGKNYHNTMNRNYTMSSHRARTYTLLLLVLMTTCNEAVKYSSEDTGLQNTNKHGVSYQGDEHVLKLDNGDGCATQ